MRHTVAEKYPEENKKSDGKFCKNEGKPLKSGPLEMEEVTEADSYWIRWEQEVANLNRKEAQVVIFWGYFHIRRSGGLGPKICL